MNLLVDIGNSRLKWAVETDGRIEVVEALDYRQPRFFSILRERWLAIEPPKKLAIASVSSKQLLTDIMDLRHSLWPELELVLPKSADYAHGVKNSYVEPERLGVDRWLGLIAAHRHYPGDVCVVDCGTAITLDAMRADGTHLGGLICPGLITMQKALASNTADLTFNARVYRTEPANSTDAAIANGVLMAALGMVEHSVRQFSSSYRLLLTGGDANTLALSLSRPCVVDEKLVLKGLSVFCEGDRLA